MVWWAVWALWVVVAVLALCVALRLQQRLSWRACPSSAHMVGRVVVVTGASSGLGLAAAEELAARGARVILACRSRARGLAARERIVRATGNRAVEWRPLDLASLRSVRAFAAHLRAHEPRLHVLVNNAGAGGLGPRRTEDRLQVGMQVNYFAPFLLTRLLLPLLRASAPSRVVNVASLAHRYGELDLDNLNMERYWSDHLVYANSKLYLVMMAAELGRRLAGSGVTANALHPGVAATRIFRHIPSALVRRLVRGSVGLLFQSEWEAAQTTVYLAAAPQLAAVSGKYFSNCAEATPAAVARDPHMTRRLWEATERLLKIDPLDDDHPPLATD